MAIGEHRGSFLIPLGWQVIQLGEKWEVRRGEAGIVLHDLGPASPMAIQRTAASIIEVWRSGNPQGAQTRVLRLYANGARFVEEPSRKVLLNTMLPLLEPAALTLPPAELADRFAEWQQAIAELPTVRLDALADAALPIAGHDQRRSIQSRQRTNVANRQAVNVMTVTQSTDTDKKRIVIIDNEGHLFAMYFGVLGHAAHLNVFDQLVRSLQFDAAASERR